ncbi:MAG: MBL fold metallo-hydrolase [Muribaculum sp.]|nr:MBL fold metallo-hydrolase [Muribaculum sp.]
MRLRFLGTGTSTGVPQIGCTCPTCISTDIHDKRLRASALLSIGDLNLLIDCGPDFREQIINAGAPHIDAALLTHSHYDHVGGIDDLRPYCHTSPDGRFPLYARPDVIEDIRNRVPYCFREHPYPGVPIFDTREIGSNPFYVNDIEITPLPVWHYKLPIVGFKIGKLAYITDAKEIPSDTMSLVKGVDTLIINALRHEEHLSHMNLSQALGVIAEAKPRVAYLTHFADKIGLQREVDPTLPKPVHMAYDNLVIEIPD